MKKITVLIAAVAFTSLAFTSCKKDYTCTCTHIDVAGGITTSVYELSTHNESDATAACADLQVDATENRAGTTTTCSL